MGYTLDSIVKYLLFDLLTISYTTVSDMVTVDNVEESYTVQVTWDNGNSVNMALSLEGTTTPENTNSWVTIGGVDAIQTITDNSGSHVWNVMENAIPFLRVKVTVTAGTAGKALADAGGGSSPETIANAVWDELLAGHTTTNSAGKVLSDAGGGSSPEVIAEAVRTELTTELSRIDVATSTRNATTPPTTNAIASQVRTELSTELSRIDVAVSTRNSTTPPTVVQIRTEIDTNSTKLTDIKEDTDKIDSVKANTDLIPVLL